MDDAKMTYANEKVPPPTRDKYKIEAGMLLTEIGIQKHQSEQKLKVQ